MSERDRDERGRARNARPRDRLGRPLPRGARPEHVEEDLPDDPERLLDIGIEHFNARRFFQAHEAWETAWHPAEADERDFWQGITQIAVGCTHVQRGNPTGAVTLLRRGAARLRGYGTAHRGVPVARLAMEANDLASRVETGGLDAATSFPAIEPRAADGP